MAYQRNPIKNAPSVPYNGQPIEPINKIHWKQQIHKYNIGLFVTGIIAMASALITLIVLSISLATRTFDADGKLIVTSMQKVLSSISTASTILFVVSLGIDVVFTVMLNKYYKNKLPLILFIPALILMIIFCVPELISLIQLFVPSIKTVDWGASSWSPYISIAICGAFIILELLRMIIHKDDLDMYSEIKKALR